MSSTDKHGSDVSVHADRANWYCRRALANQRNELRLIGI